MARQNGNNNTRRFSRIAGLMAAALGGAVLMALFMMVFTPFGGESVAASTARGKALAELVCIRCHAVGPTGSSPNPKSPPFRTLLARLTIEGLMDEIDEGLPMGHRPMPPWNFSQEQKADLVNYIISLKPPS